MVERFEDLVAWQKARILVRDIYAITRTNRFEQDFALRRQMQRAGVSIMANIAEGFERFNPAEFRYFLSIAKSSCAEISSHLYVALDVDYLSKADFERMLCGAEEVGRVIGGLRASIKR